MRTPFISLVWKEWREHEWKLASVTAVMLGVTSLTLLLSGEEKFGAAWTMLTLCAFVFSGFVGLGTAAGERSQETLPFLQSLPVPLWKSAIAKLMVGYLTVALPIALTVASFYAWRYLFDRLDVNYVAADLRRDPYLFLQWFAVTLLFATSVWIWLAAIGVNRKDEISAAAVALAVIVGWSLLIGFVANWLLNHGIDAIASFLAGLAPGGLFALIARETQYIWVLFTTAAATHLLLLCWFVVRFGQVSEREVRSPLTARRSASTADWLGPPRSSMATAIAWKQFRESGPIATVGLVAVFGITALLFLLEEPRSRSQVFTAVAVTMGFGMALVVGIGVALNDLKPQQNTFWRSRPINPSQWFWIKYSVGLAVVLASIYLPIWLSGGGPLHDPEARFVVPGIHIALFAAAVAMTCLVRQAVYAAVFSVAALFVSTNIAWLVWQAYYWLENGKFERGLWPLGDSGVVAGGMILCFVACTLLARLAMGYDWGRKSRY